jgi:hypothetical protein
MSSIGEPIREIEVLPIFLPEEVPAEVVPEREAEPVQAPVGRTHAHASLA